MHKKMLGAAALFIAIAQNSFAAPIKYSFSASDFTGYNHTDSPMSSVTGSYTIDGGALTGFDTTIGGTHYSLPDVGLQYFNDNQYWIGGLLNGSGGLSVATNDFILRNFNLSGQSPSFAYAIQGMPDFWSGQLSISQISSAPAVPLPASLPLFASGILGIALARRKKTIA